MNNKQELDTIHKDLVVSMEYQLKVDGELVDFSEENDPLLFIQGRGHIIPGLESQIEGMKIGENREIFVKAADAYGEFDPEEFTEVARSEFPAEIPLEVGVEVTMEDEDGEELTAFIEEVNDENVTLNFNHPLSGKDLTFMVKIIGIRAATDEELEHDHVHDDDHAGHDHED